MFRTLINAWKVKDIRSKILFTVLLFVIYRLGAFIPVPGVDVSYIAEQVDKMEILGFLNLFSGGSFSSFSVFAMGISPYITGSIIIQLLTIAIPALEKLSKEEDGRKKIEKITRYTGIVLALVQSIGIVASLGAEAVESLAWWNYARIGIICTAGTAILLWMGERITEKGIGNGVSMIIFASIVSQVPSVVLDIVKGVAATTYYWWIIPVVIIVVLVLVAGIVAVEKAQRKIPVQYAKKVVGRKQYGGQSTFLPIKANSNGVMPLIFAITIMQMPAMIGQLINGGTNAFYKWWMMWCSASAVNTTDHVVLNTAPNEVFVPGVAIYYVVYALLILGFAYFYTMITFNPYEIAKNMQENGGFIPGIRPGKPTCTYLTRISNRLTLFGAIFLMLVATIPAVVLKLYEITVLSAFGATSILIMVSVALETSNQLESLMLMRHYKGFLN
ncbi:MAG: preprotein translocase subunit SecY [Clostridia bacterium]|nr:preprotein translocase subunit SecY [Clostridia bacterium]